MHRLPPSLPVHFFTCIQKKCASKIKIEMLLRDLFCGIKPTNCGNHVFSTEHLVGCYQSRKA